MSGNSLAGESLLSAAITTSVRLPCMSVHEFSFLSRVLMRGILPQPMLADNGERLKVCLIHMNS